MARTTDLPIHFRTGLRALGLVNGRPVWPILGGEESDEAAKAAAARAAEDAAKAAADAAKAAEGERGFPLNTPLEQMKPEQREAYWKYQARKHEDRNKAFGGLTAEKFAEMQDKAKKHDELDLERGTTADKAAAKAAEEAKTATRTEYLPEVISAKLDAAAARAGVSEDDLAKAIEFVDTAKFLGAGGKVDADKVKAFITTLSPGKGNNGDGRQTHQRGPSSRGQGGNGSRSSSNNTKGGNSVASGRDLWAEKHPART